jgi:hypothetical protein
MLSPFEARKRSLLRVTAQPLTVARFSMQPEHPVDRFQLGGLHQL